MRQAKPWEAIGISRATWYRHGKPTENPPRTSIARAARTMGASSTRTFQRIQSLYKKATGDGPQSVTAAIFWAKTRMGWRETQHHEHTAPNGLVFMSSPSDAKL